MPGHTAAATTANVKRRKDGKDCKMKATPVREWAHPCAEGLDAPARTAWLTWTWLAYGVGKGFGTPCAALSYLPAQPNGEHVL